MTGLVSRSFAHEFTPARGILHTSRGAIVGLMMGATQGVDAIPKYAIEGLADCKEIAAEIDAFVSFIMAK